MTNKYLQRVLEKQAKFGVKTSLGGKASKVVGGEVTHGAVYGGKSKKVKMPGNKHSKPEDTINKG